MTNYLSHAETNKLIRKALKESFPGIKFSVRKNGGATYIKWTDGPNQEQVDGIVRNFQGANFCGMTDYKGGNVHEMDGEIVHFGADFIFTNRKVSETNKHRAANRALIKCGSEISAEKLIESVRVGDLIQSRDIEAKFYSDQVRKFTSFPFPKSSKTTESVKLVRTY